MKHSLETMGMQEAGWARAVSMRAEGARSRLRFCMADDPEIVRLAYQRAMETLRGYGFRLRQMNRTKDFDSWSDRWVLMVADEADQILYDMEVIEQRRKAVSNGSPR